MSRDLRAGVALQARRSRERFLSAISEPLARETQSDLLRQCLRPNAHTTFGREHDFAALASFDDYRAAVPIRSYSDFSTWIERSASGEDEVLTRERPIRFWKTTGTTSEPKKIPVTPASAARTTESFLALQGTQLLYYPELNERNDTTLVTHISPKPIKQHLGPYKIPFCTTTELPIDIRAGREEFFPPWLPGLQQMAEDDSERLYYLLCYAAAHDLYAIACLHPSRFQTVSTALEQNAERLLRELEAGTVCEIPVRAPDPQRAARLRAARAAAGRLRARDVWPNLSMLTAWSGSYISRYRQTMEESFCSGFLPMPSVSSEVFLTMTVDPDPISQPLNLRGGVFEFVPAEQETHPGSLTSQFFELQVGRCYEAIITTLAGLYRYATADLFKVVAYQSGAPRLEYVGRRSVSDLTGEKLAEDQVAQAVPATLAEFGLRDFNFVLCGLQGQGGGELPCYVLVLEPGQEGLISTAEVAAALDLRLRAINSRYELKRSFGDLAPASVRLVSPGTFARYRQVRIAEGAPPGQLKDRILTGEGAPLIEDLARWDQEKP
jgi:hypothetical protein